MCLLLETMRAMCAKRAAAGTFTVTAMKNDERPRQRRSMINETLVQQQTLRP